MPTPLYNRTKKDFKLPNLNFRKTAPLETYIEDDCCLNELVLAHLSDKATWKNDIKSAWWKPEDVTDNVNFVLYKENGTLATYQPSKVTFPKDEEAYYGTIYWSEVLAIDGAGCYTYKVEYTEDVVSKTYTWGEYELQGYTTEKAQNTIRTRVIMNQYVSSEDIDMTDSKLEDTMRFGGLFGAMKPNYVIDNLIYENRKLENVQREKVATYEMNSDILRYNQTSLLIDYHLLTENKIFLSDHNDFNHSLFYKDFEVIVSKSPEIQYKELSNLATISCEFQNKERNELAKYNG
jgi:hypothetical protein